VLIPKNATILVGLSTSVGGVGSHEPEDLVLLVTVTEVIFIFCMRSILQRLIGRRVK